MSPRLPRLGAIFCCAYGFALLPGTMHAASLLPVYPPPFSSFDIDAQDINDAGTVTGGITAGNGGYLATASSIQPLGKPAGYDSFSGFGINNSGQVAGNAMVLSNTYWHAAVANSGGTFHDLGTLGGTSSYATAISDNGWVAGYSQIAGDGGMRAFLYANGVMEDLGTLGYGPAVGEMSKAFDINASGVVTGSALNEYGRDHAFVYSNGIMQDLGTLALDGSSSGLAINDHGDVVGAYYGTGYGHAFLHRNGIMQDLGTLGGSYGTAMDINNAGQIVGFSSTAAGGAYNHAFFYEGGQMFDLNLLYAGLLSDGTTAGFTRLDIARGINESGMIVGGGRYFDGLTYFEDYAFILDTRDTPGGTVPEAGHTLGLLTGACAGLVMWRRKGRGGVRPTVVAVK